jgi:hypothetical protein
MYVKLFGTLLHSSIWVEDPSTRLVWITLLLMANRDGYVRASPSGLARAANVSKEDTVRALEVLAAPDEESGSPEYEGRRIEAVEGGWFLLNYSKYRELRTEKDVYNAAKQKRYRDRKKEGNALPTLPEVTEDNHFSASASASASISGDSVSFVEPNLFGDDAPEPDTNHKKDLATVVDFYLETHPTRRVVNEAGRQKIRTRLAEGFTIENLKDAIRGNAIDPWHIDKRKHGLEYVLRNPDMVNDFIGKYERLSEPEPGFED